MGTSVLVQSFVVIVIGGVGSFGGAIVGGFVAGEIVSLTSVFAPGLGPGGALSRDGAGA